MYNTIKSKINYNYKVVNSSKIYDYKLIYNTDFKLQTDSGRFYFVSSKKIII